MSERAALLVLADSCKKGQAYKAKVMELELELAGSRAQTEALNMQLMEAKRKMAEKDAICTKFDIAKQTIKSLKAHVKNHEMSILHVMEARTALEARITSAKQQLAIANGHIPEDILAELHRMLDGAGGGNAVEYVDVDSSDEGM
jgi:predicted  nucleic acid-binding Zn-ribbon protein